MYTGKKGIVFFACLLLLTMFSRCGYAAITTASPLSMKETLSSSNGIYELGFFSLDNSQNQYVGIWYKNINPRVVVWVANRDKPVTDPMANLTIGSNGNLILIDGTHNVVWSSGETMASNESLAELLDNGNFVLKDNVSGISVWQSFEHLGDTVLPQSTLMYDLPNGYKRALTSWKSPTDPSTGDFVLEITPQEPSQVFTLRGSAPYWRSGPWARTRFTGIPEMDESYNSPFSLVQDFANGTGYLSYSLRRHLYLPHITLTSDGSLKVIRNNGTGWVVDFEAPKNLCDMYGACGPFGLCESSIRPKCKCFKGFKPKFIEEWKTGNWTGGCVRRAELSCLGNSSATTQGKDPDFFYRVANVKPPDLYEFISSATEEKCYQSCLHNCSCTAFAYINGIGCLVWNQELVDTVQFPAGGEFVSLRLASSESAGNKRIKAIVASTVSLSIFLISVFAAYVFWRFRVKHNNSTDISEDALQEAWRKDLKPQDVSGLHYFDMNTIRTATDNFNISNKLGQGGFGSVYKGKLQDGKEIAVKRLSSSSGQGTEEFMNEIILISKLQHRNLVRLLGSCIEGEEKLLIYEFMVNKSLDAFLFDSKKKLDLDWPKRFDIIQGIARGLLYLHRDSCLRVVHRDLKVSNILLDEKMNPKISDFGLARMFEGTQCQDNTRRVVGTLGYMSPEYAWTGMFSEKSDIYSFGVLLLEIVSGKKISNFSFGEEGKSLIAYAWESWCNTGGVILLDQDLSGSCGAVEVARCVQIALLCIQHKAVERPNITEVVSMLTTTTDLPTPKQPIFAMFTGESVSQSKVLFCVNEMSHTVTQER